MNKTLFFCLSALLLLPCCCLVPSDDELVIMTWNVQNLFDDVAQGSEYSEYDPDSGEWNSGLYHLKLAAVADVIKSTEARDPDLVLLQEVENAGVIEDLLDMYLVNRGYSVYDLSSEEYGAVHTAFLSRYPVTEIRAHSVWGTDLTEQRFIMEYRCTIGKEPVVIFNNHWKSKAGSDSGEDERRAAACVLDNRATSALHEHRLVLAGGDFNCAITDGEFFQEDDGDGTRLLSAFTWLQPENGKGSYAYNGQWEAIDMILVPSGQCPTVCCMEYFSGEFIRNSSGYPAAFNAASGQGYSDHLPLIAVLDL
ncbi:MAG: endonuclease/exonuclease/phosphatase family protein [Spirochaetales bacterium]|nr:endonuclease/exonuclease/phosphatase family protein [Spirochaetales bacterium]